MKILMIAPTPFFSHRGTHIRIFEEASALERLGHDITIVTYHNGEDIGNLVQTHIDVRRIHRWLFWYKKTEAGPDWQKVFLNFFLIVKTFNMIIHKKPSVIHAHLHEGVLIGRIMQCVFFWRHLPLVSDFHGSLVGEMRSHGYLSVPPLGTIFRAMEHWINGMGTVAVVSSEENISTIKRARKDHTVYHICDGVDLGRYDKYNDVKKIRRKYDVPQNAFVIVYTGALIKNKGIDHILQTIPFAIKKIANIHFVIGGFPDAWVRQYISQKKLQKYVTIISPLSYFVLPEVNVMADVAIDPKDGNVRQASGKLLQYMAANVGIICADRPTNRKYLSDKSAQFLSQITPDTLTQAIVRYFDDRSLLRSCAYNAHKDAVQFDWQNAGKKLNDIYEKIFLC